MGKTIVRTMVDTYTTSTDPKKNFGTINKMRLGTTSLSFLGFALPFPPGSKILNAKLHFYSSSSWTGSVTVTAKRISSKWSANKITWNNDPGTVVGGATGTATKTGAGIGTHWVMDVAALIQQGSATFGWYGIQLSAPGAAKSLYSMQAPANYRPWLELEWNENPTAPDDLVPSDGATVNENKPVLSYDNTDQTGDITLDAQQIQIATNPAMATPIHDSGVSLTDIPQYDLNTAGVTLTAGTVYYWRVRTRDGSGAVSPWSTVESFQYKAQPVLTLTSPSIANAYVEEATPLLTWTLTGSGGTQRAYQAKIYSPDSELLWDTGKVTSTNNYVTVPKKIITLVGQLYTLEVSVWNTDTTRVATPGAPNRVTKTLDFLYQYNASVTSPSSISAQSALNSPAYLITAVRNTAPDYFTLMRNDEVVQSNINPADVQDPLNPTNYIIEDYPPSRRSTKWEVVAVQNGKSSVNNPTRTETVQRTLSWLQSVSDSSIVAGFTNPDHDLEDGDNSAVVYAMAGNPSLVTQSLYGESGTFSGHLTNYVSTGLTARQMRNNLRTIRKKYGGRARLYFSDETMDVYIYGLKIKRISYADGNTEYDVQFSFFEVE